MKIKIKCDISQYLKVPQLEGDLIMTNYKLIFKHIAPMERLSDGRTQTIKVPPFLDEYLKIPLTCINRMDKTVN